MKNSIKTRTKLRTKLGLSLMALTFLLGLGFITHILTMSRSLGDVTETNCNKLGAIPRITALYDSGACAVTMPGGIIRIITQDIEARRYIR